jgi:hypothetical protein
MCVGVSERAREREREWLVLSMNRVNFGGGTCGDM